jgi:acyl carrier protein
MQSKETIFLELRRILSESFEIDPEAVKLDANLYEDLELDSIDAIDLIVSVQDLIGRKVQPDNFKAARTVSDVVDIVYDLINGQ